MVTNPRAHHRQRLSIPTKPRPCRRLPGIPGNGDSGPPHARHLRAPPRGALGRGKRRPRNRVVRTPHPPANPPPHGRHPPQANRARLTGRLHALAAQVAAPGPPNAALRRRRRLRSPPPARGFRSSRHRVGAHPPPRPHRQLRPPLARRPLPLRSRRLGPHLPSPSLVHGRRGRPPPRHPNQRSPHHLLHSRNRRLASPRPRPAMRGRVQVATGSKPRSPPTPHPPPAARRLLRTRHPAHRQLHPPANPACPLGAGHRRPCRRRRLRSAPRLHGPAPQIHHHRNPRQTHCPKLRRPLVAPLRRAPRRSNRNRASPTHRRRPGILRSSATRPLRCPLP